MKKLFEELGAVEVKGSSSDLNAIYSAIKDIFTKYKCTIEEQNSHSFKFKSKSFLKRETNPFLGISSGKVEIINKNNKNVIKYRILRKELFWQAIIAVGIVGIFTHQNLDISQTHEVIAYIVGLIIMYFAIYGVYFGVNGTFFNQLLIKTANKAVK